MASLPTHFDEIAELGGETVLIVVARYVVSEGHDSTVARLLRKNAQASRAEPGCLEFSV